MAKKISNEAVKKSTGKVWSEWFALLNKEGAKQMEHKAIAEMLHKKHGLSGWWSQMVTVQYEQEIKGRKKHETSKGYQISKSKTLLSPVAKIFNAVLFSAERKIWLKHYDFTITKSTKNKSIRGKWIDGKTNIEFQFYQKDKNKSRIVVQHNRISSASEADKMKTYWQYSITKLNNYLNKSSSIK
jgi:hypothetical protein